MSARDWEHGRVARLLGQHEVGEVSGTIQIVQVGSGSAERDTGFYSDEVQKFIDNPNVHAVLIEPNPVSFRRLKQNLVSRYGTVDRFTLLNTAVCPDASPALPLLKCCLFREGCDWPNPCPMIGKGPTIPFYVVSETFLQDYPNAPKWAVFQLGNADRQTVLKYHKQLGFGLTKDQFSKYITKIDVPCVNMRQLMDQHARLQANQVDFFDAPIDNWGAFIWEDWLVIGGQNAVGAVVERLHLRKLEQWTFYVSFGRHNFCIDEHKDSGLTIAYQNRGETAALKAARVQNPRKTMVQDRIKLLAKDTSKQLHFLQVGACDGDFDTKTSNDPVQSVIYQEHITAALVEPNPPMFKKLVKNVESFFGNTSRIRTFNMAMCPDKSGQVSFFVVKPEFAIEYPWKPHWAKYQLSSMNRDHILHKHGEVGMEKATWEKYILELRVPCKTPGDMLEAAGMKVKQVDLLQVDAEGYDAKIVEAFMKLKDFDPQIIVFEDVHLGPDEITHVTEILKKRNYHVHPKLRGNTMAIKPELERKDKNHKKR